MPEHEVPLEELHEHIQEHAHESKEKWVSGVALSTALLATAAAIAALLTSKYESHAMIEQIEKADGYAYYQAKSLKSNLLQSEIKILKALDKKPSEEDQAQLAKYAGEMKEIKAGADAKGEMAEKHEAVKDLFAFSVTMFQISIAIGAISVLTRRKMFWFVSLVFGATGLFFLASGYLKIPAHEGRAEHAEHAKEAPEKGGEKGKEGAGKGEGEGEKK